MSCLVFYFTYSNFSFSVFFYDKMQIKHFDSCTYFSYSALYQVALGINLSVIVCVKFYFSGKEISLPLFPFMKVTTFMKVHFLMKMKLKNKITLVQKVFKFINKLEYLFYEKIMHGFLHFYIIMNLNLSSVFP